MVQNRSLLLSLFVNLVASNCRPADILNIVGGSYTVDFVTTSHVEPASYPFLAIGGKCTNSTDNSSMGFVYFLEYNICNIMWSLQFPFMNEGFVDLHTTGDYVIFRGYGSNSGRFNEQMQVYHQPTLTLITTAIYPDALPREEIGIMSSSYSSQDKTIIVSPKQIRVYFTDLTSELRISGSVKTYTHDDSNTSAASFTKKWMLIMGLSATETVIKGFLIESDFSQPSFVFSFPQDHGGAGQSKLTVLQEDSSTESQLKVLQSTSLHNGSAQTTLLNYLLIKIDINNKLVSADALTLTFVDAFKCLHLLIDGTTANVVFVNSSSRLTLLTISLENGSIVSTKVTDPIPFYSVYSTVSPADKIAFAKNWDYFIVGTSSSLSVQGRQVQFQQPVGFAMALTKNRRTSIINSSAAQPVYRMQKQTTTVLSGGVASGYQLISDRKIKEGVFVKQDWEAKNEWIDQLPQCWRFRGQQPYMFCFYYQFFEQYSGLVSTLKDTAPQTAFSCNKTQGFELTEFRKMSEADLNIRSTCYPFYLEMVNQGIPTDSQGNPMLVVDRQNLFISWSPYLNPQMLGYWFYQYSERTDQAKDMGDFLAVFAPFTVSNRVFKLSALVPWTYTIDIPAYAFNFQVQCRCLSRVCPDFIRYNTTNYTFWSDMLQTNQRILNATYVYQVDTQYQYDPNPMAPPIILNETLTLEVAAWSQNTVGININLPFDAWYVLNKNRIKYYAPPTQSVPILQDVFSFLPGIEGLSTNDDQLGEKNVAILQKSAVSGWTTEQLDKAYEEARMRSLLEPSPIQFTTNFDQSGLLTIKFSTLVNFPSYLLTEVNQSQTTSKNGGRRLGSRLDVFWKAEDYKQNTSLWASKASSSASLKDSGLNVQTDGAISTRNAESSSSKDSQSTKNASQNSKDSGQSSLDYFSAGSTQYFVNKSEQETKSVQAVQANNQDFESFNKQQLQTQTSNEVEDCTSSQYFDIKLQSCQDLVIYFGSLDDLFKITYQSGQDESTVEMTYKVISISQEQIQVQLNFLNPLDVMATDKLAITMNFGEFNNVEPQIEATQQCVRQAVQSTATRAADAVGKMSMAATAATVVGSAVLQTLVSGCLAQIWGMINGMQFIIHLPALNVEFPQNAFSIIEKILLVACFDIPYLNMGTVQKVFTLPPDDSILDSPEQANIKASFQQLGYESAYMSNNLGSIFVIILVTTFSLCLIFLLEGIKIPLVQRVNQKLKKQFLWNFVIRLVIESYLELGFSVYFNLRYAKCHFAYLGSWVNYFYAVAFAGALVAAPIFVIVFYSRNFSRLSDEDFEGKFGSVYEGLKTSERYVIAYTPVFLARRALFTLTSLFLYKHVMIQMGCAMVIALASGCYILHFKPFEDPLINRLEAMNETTTLLLIDLICLFTPLIESQKLKYRLGFAFIAMLACCIAVHLFFLFTDMAKQFLARLKVWRSKWNARKAKNQQRSPEQLVEAVIRNSQENQSSSELRRQPEFVRNRSNSDNKQISFLESIKEVSEVESSVAEVEDLDQSNSELILQRARRNIPTSLSAEHDNEAQANIIVVKAKPANETTQVVPSGNLSEIQKQRVILQRFLLGEVEYPEEKRNRRSTFGLKQQEQ